MEIIATMEIMEIMEISEITEIMEILQITVGMNDNFDFVCEGGGACNALSPGDPDGGCGLRHIILSYGGEGQIHHGCEDRPRMLTEVLKPLQRDWRRVRRVPE
jgi:hypothetical protein